MFLLRDEASAFSAYNLPTTQLDIVDVRFSIFFAKPKSTNFR